MIDLEAIALRRADEQCATERLSGYQERDSWDVKSTKAPEKPRKRAHCLAGDCPRPVRNHGYCHACYERIRRGMPVERGDWEPGRKPKGAA